MWRDRRERERHKRRTETNGYRAGVKGHCDGEVKGESRVDTLHVHPALRAAVRNMM